MKRTRDDYTGTPRRIFLEVGEVDDEVGALIREEVAASSRTGGHFAFDASTVVAADAGYVLRIPAQLVPELVRTLAQHNIAVYQVVSLDEPVA